MGTIAASKLKILRKGMLIEYQEGFAGYNENGHLSRPIGKIVKVIDKKKMKVLVKPRDGGKITHETIGKTVLFP